MKRLTRPFTHHGAHAKKSRLLRLASAPVVGAVAVLASGLGGGVAYAYFTSHGSGIGSATTYTPQGITVTAAATPAANPTLYPGGPAATVHFTVDNPNPYQVTFTGWSGAILSTVAPVGANACTIADFQIASASGSFASALAVPANTASSPGVSGTAGAVVELKNSAQNGCQGATVTVLLTLTGGRSQ